MAEEDRGLVMVGIDPETMDRLKVYAARVKKTMREVIESLLRDMLKKAGE